MSRRPLIEALSDAKDFSELMVDLAFAGLFYGDDELCHEVLDLEDELNALVHEMRQVCLLASRTTQDAERLASIIQLIGAIEMIGNQAVDIAKIHLRGMGIPEELRVDLSGASEVVSRMVVQPASTVVHRSLTDLALPTTVGTRILAVRRAGRWRFDPPGEEVLAEDDVVVARGPAEGVAELRRLVGAVALETRPPVAGPAFNELDRAVDIVVEMKNLAEVSVGLGYAALLIGDRALATEVNRLEDSLDEMREHLEEWVLRAAAEARPGQESTLRGLLRLGGATETIGDAAQSMVWLVERDEPLHPILADALGEADETVFRSTVQPGSRAAGATPSSLKLKSRTGLLLLALRRGGRWHYRPRAGTPLEAGDELLLTGPWEAEDEIARLTGEKAEATAG